MDRPLPRSSTNNQMLRLLRVVAPLLVAAVVGSAAARSGEISRDDFPRGFTFGAGTSAYQWEGAAAEDGRTPSVWDTFAHARSNSGDDIVNGDVAADGYHKHKEDIKLMKETGLDAYRFSISWPRLIPNGRGEVNIKGVEYYNNLINELLDHVTSNSTTGFYVPGYGLQEVLEHLKQSYGNPAIYIHENGYPMHQDVVFDDGPRLEFLSEHLRSLLTALRNGSNTRGYFVWSLMDLYELLSLGDTYGLYYVDFADKDLKRYPRSSAIWYSDFLKGRKESRLTERFSDH